MASNDSRPIDRARFAVEAAFIAATPHFGSTPIEGTFVASHPEVGIVRSLQDLVDADEEAAEQGKESVTEQFPEPESADERDAPDPGDDRFADIDIPWESPFVGYVDEDPDGENNDDSVDGENNDDSVDGESDDDADDDDDER
jgi:hypothetical protein